MSEPEPPAIRFHEDADLFRESVNLTAAETAFATRLIEKDYFCTVLLAHLAAARSGDLVFKGGTCLAKVHAEFCRLSEDLDFVIPMPVAASRSARSKRVAGVKEAMAGLPNRFSRFRLIEPFTGTNNLTQYIAVVGYTSLLSRQEDSIKVEVSLREPLLTPVVNGWARTILLDPVSGSPLVPPVSVSCISKTEAVAEKFRAALSRRDVAVRDFFDIDYAVRKGGLRPDSAELVNLVRQKLAVPRDDPVDVSAARLADLRRQLESELRPVLRDRDFSEFDVERAFDTVAQMAKAAG